MRLVLVFKWTTKKKTDSWTGIFWPTKKLKTVLVLTAACVVAIFCYDLVTAFLFIKI
jgi:hypothetical protein